MKLNWDLTDLFENDEEFYKEIDRVRKKVEKIQKDAPTTVDANGLVDLLDEKWAIKERSNSILVYGSLRYYKNIEDEVCIQMKAIAEKS